MNPEAPFRCGHVAAPIERTILNTTTFSLDRPLHAQLDELAAVVRTEPEAAKFRVFYFQLLCVLGQWRQASEQLEACDQLELAAIPMARAYRELIQGELLRAEVFAGRTRPAILGTQPEWLKLLIDALALAEQGDNEAAATMRARALDLAPAHGGHINDDAFEWIADSDSRLGPVCELYVDGQYVWLPFSEIRLLAFEKPRDLRDLVWLACEVTLHGGGKRMGFLPTRYPLQANDDDRLRLARRTEWREIGGGQVAASGQRTWATDSGDYALLDVRRVDLDRRLESS